jgi:hypothetical protein
MTVAKYPAFERGPEVHKAVLRMGRVDV